jgi:hypothetical protein
VARNTNSSSQFRHEQEANSQGTGCHFLVCVFLDFCTSLCSEQRA